MYSLIRNTSITYVHTYIASAALLILPNTPRPNSLKKRALAMLRLKAAVLLVLPCPLRIQAIHRPEIQIIDNDADNDRDNDVFFLGTGIHDM
jgi:hypothetical protein